MADKTYSPDGKSPKQKRARVTQARIFRAARSEFSAKGFHGARIDSIANRAKVNKQRIYAHFGRKEALFAEVLRQSFIEIIAAEKALLSTSEQDIPALGNIILRHYVTFHQSHPHFWRLLAWENLDGGHHTKALASIKDDTFEHLRHLYEIGQQRECFPAGVSFTTFIFTLSAISFFCFSNRLTVNRTLGIDLAEPPIQEQTIAEVLHLLHL